MEILPEIPLTLDERLEFDQEFRLPATWDEFLDALEKSQYRIEYDEGEIIFLGFETFEHEAMLANVYQLFGKLLDEDSFTVFASNLPLHIPGSQKRFYVADCTVLKGEAEHETLRGYMQALSNPILLVEVLSVAYHAFDFGIKFRNYRKIPSLQQVLFIESTEMLILNYTRSSGNRWILEEFSKPDDQVPILGEGFISVKELYEEINL